MRKTTNSTLKCQKQPRNEISLVFLMNPLAVTLLGVSFVGF